MKLKYYMRGIGIGVFVTTIILVIAFALNGNNISDEEVIARAKKLGMVESESTKNTTLNSTSKNNTTNSTSNTTDTPGNQTIDGATGAMPESTAGALGNNNMTAITDDNDFVVFTIDQGEVSRTVIDKLVAAGLVSDAYTFNKFLNDKGVDNNLQPGTFKIKKGINQDELANLLATKQQFREGI